MVRDLLNQYNSPEKRKAFLDNVRENIEFYYDKTYSCESVIKELFIRGIDNYIKNKKNTRVLQIIPNYTYFQMKDGYLLKHEVMLIIFEEITELDC
jgi:hypothetical protein